MNRYRILFAAFLVTSVVLGDALELDAAKKQKKKSSGKGKSKVTALRSKAQDHYLKYAAAQLPNSRRSAARARSALDSAVSQVRTAGQTLQNATQKLEEAKAAHQDAERAAFQSLPDNHEFRNAWTRYQEAVVNYQAATSEAFVSDTYKAAAAAARKAKDPSAALADLRQETLESDSSVLAARINLRLAKDEVERLRRQMLDNDSQWAAAAFSVRSAREEVNRADAALDYALKGRGRALSTANKAAAVVNISEAAKRRLQFEKSLSKRGGGSKKKSKSGKKSKSSKKKKKKY